MYEPHGCFETPDDTVTIWRYMKWPDFCSVLANGALFFVRADRFQDTWEGLYPPKHFERDHLLAPMKHILEKEPHREQEYLDRARRRLINTQDERHDLGVSCWHMGDGESDSHWRSYSRMDEGVAIKSTVGRLKESLAACPVRVYLGKVSYYSAASDLIQEGNLFWPVLHKRKAFSNDHEVRAVIRNSYDVTGFNEHGAHAKVDLDLPVQELVVSPSAGQWFTEMVKDVIGRFDLSFPVTRSALFDPPEYFGKRASST